MRWLAPRPLAIWLISAVLSVVACEERSEPIIYQSLPVLRRDITVNVQAAGVIEPEVTVEVKSKTSGEILQMLVETGDRVEQGELLLRIDNRQPQNRLAEAEAELVVARARLANAGSQLKRAQKLFGAESMSEASHDQAVLDRANANADTIRAEIAVENARIVLEDAMVYAPITGTIISKNVERGQVISSATTDVSGGTILLSMADLSRVRVRTLVDETDLGRVRPSQNATVIAAAFPERAFDGVVLKIEPLAVTEQNVTMFPVLVSVSNPNSVLKPGMNSEVEIHISRREQALAVPNAALRTDSDVGSAAELLGLSAQEVRSQLESGARHDGSHIVFALRNGEPVPVRIRTGLTDLDYSEVVSDVVNGGEKEGLRESDSVLILPSRSLVQSQQRFKERIERVRGDGLPGVRRSSGKESGKSSQRERSRGNR
jgi:HlyD family secretion protein